MLDNCEPTSSLDVRRHALLDVTVQIDRGHLVVTMYYPNGTSQMDRIVECAAEYTTTLDQLAAST